MTNTETKKSINFTNILWDLWCIVSVVGIWPRFIEPKLLQVKELNLDYPNLSKDLEELKILQFSDLHINPDMSDNYLKKLIKKARAHKPDIIVFVGDFLCYAKLKEKKRLRDFLRSFSAPYGCYAILGNHDYSQFVSINEHGEYDVIDKSPSQLSRGFFRLFTKTILTKTINKKINDVTFNQELIETLKETPFELLHNENKLISIKNSKINICGLGEFMLGRSLPKEAFANYDQKYFGIVLAHNPDSIPALKKYPGDLILSGHTHGGQVNLPWMWKKFTLLENMQYKYGLKKVDDKWAFISRGVGSVMPFRWFAIPEIISITLRSSK